MGAPVRPPPRKRRKDGPSRRDADAEPSAGARLALASRGDDTRGDVPFGNEPFAAHCTRAADLVRRYPDQPDVLSLRQVLASQVTRVGLPKALALKDAGVVAGWGRFREYEAEVASLRRVCERKLGERIMLSTLQVESLAHLADHEQVNILFFDPTWGKNGDEKNVGQRCYTYVVRDVYVEAAAIGVISADDARRLSEGQFVADTMPFAMDVSRNGKRLRPHVELLRLCSDEEELRDKLLDTHHKAVTAAVWTLARARRLMGKATCIVGWGLEGSEFAIRLGQETGGDYLGSLFHPEQLKNAKQDVMKLLKAGRDVAILSHAGMLCCQHVFQSIACFRDVMLYREMTLFLEYYDKNSVGYQMLREARSKASAELWLDDRYREKVIKGLKKFWKDLSPEKKEAFLAPRQANGFGGDISKALEKDAILEAEGPAGAKKAERRKANRVHAETSRKRARDVAEALAQEAAELTGRGATLLGRLGRDGSKVLDDDVDDGDEFGGRLEKDDYQAGAAALAAMRAMKDQTPEDKKEIKKACAALSAIRRRAREKASLDKLRRRVALLRNRVAELGEELVAVLEEKLRARAAAAA